MPSFIKTVISVMEVSLILISSYFV